MATAIFGAVPLTDELSVTFTVFSAVPMERVTYFPEPVGSPLTPVFYPSARSPRYEFHGRNPLRFYRVTDDRTDRPSPSSVVAEAYLPAGVSDVLLIFVPITSVSARGLRHRIHVLDDGLGRLPRGSVAIINFSGLSLVGTLEGKPLVLRDGLNPSFAVGRSAKIVLRTPFKERTYQSYADTVDLGPEERALLILFPPYRPGSLEVQSRLLLDEKSGRPLERR
jgi:hypothetical protein